MLAIGGCASNPPTGQPSGRAAALPRDASREASPAVRALRRDLARVVGAPPAARGQWGVVVRSLSSGETLYASSPGKLMTPASALKIVTMATAARTLGWDYRFSTRLETHAPVEAGVLKGDLIVRGTGDPSIGSRNARAAAVFDGWARALSAAGIREIAGRIVGDDQLFDDQGLGPGWMWDDLADSAAAPVGALQYDENVASLLVYPGAADGDPAILRIPSGTGLTIVNRAVTTSAGLPQTITARRRPASAVVDVTGTIPLLDVPPERARTLALVVPVVNPTQYFVESLRDALIARGIAVRGPAVDYDDVAAELLETAGDAAPRILATAESPPLRELGAVMMKDSQNLYAETFLKASGQRVAGLGTFSAGRIAVAAALDAWGLNPGDLVLADGSGLSRYNYVTPELLTRLLERLYGDPAHREPFVASLPLAGVDGTLERRLRRSRAEGQVTAKTGTLANVRALSGFVRTRDGEPLAFTMLVNGFGIPGVTANWIIDLIVETLANFTRSAEVPS